MCFERGCSDSVRSSSDNQIQRYVESVYPSNNLSFQCLANQKSFDPKLKEDGAAKEQFVFANANSLQQQQQRQQLQQQMLTICVAETLYTDTSRVGQCEYAILFKLCS